MLKTINDYVDELSTDELLDFVNGIGNQVVATIEIEYFKQFKGDVFQTDQEVQLIIADCIHDRIAKLWADMYKSEDAPQPLKGIL